MPTTSNSDGDLLLGAVVGAVMGVVWFFRGFKELKIKRTIQNIPTSKINTGAVGTDVEIKGNIIVEPDKILTAPISGQPCALFHMEIQKELRRKNSTYWKTIDPFYSHEGFYVDDQSGATALVMVAGAEVNREGKTDEEVYVLGHAESGLRLQKIKKPKFKYFFKAKKAIQKDKQLAALC